MVGIEGMMADLLCHCDNALLVVLDMQTAPVDMVIGMEPMVFRLRGKVGYIAVDRR